MKTIHALSFALAKMNGVGGSGMGCRPAESLGSNSASSFSISCFMVFLKLLKWLGFITIRVF
jgi:hypothetical protein